MILVRGAHHEFGLEVRSFNAVGRGGLPDVKRGGQVRFGMSHVVTDFIYKFMLKQSPFEIIGQGKGDSGLDTEVRYRLRNR